ncbi:TetR/AcrR family transcriptional regulator [Lacibacterium aquatile]|uniref:TetR/AcrR family transcriptional regulator n=1 Tax=Lacibacterium aquatile TaxID=1168082 RepID=A0ABW5DKL6_9PROT
MNDMTPMRGVSTRDRLLDLAEEAILAKGFAATSIEELITAVGITKSGFFYHFRDKNALAKALIQRYLERDDAIFDALFARADELNEDPLHGLLVALKLLAEELADLPQAHPGCLVATFCYQSQLFNQEIRDLNAAGILAWRARFRGRFALIEARYPPRPGVDLDALADMAMGIIEGAILAGRALKDPRILPGQILLYRDYVRTVFAG